MSDKHKPKPLAWDERDYKLWSDIQQLPSFGRLANDDRMISLKDVGDVLEAHATKRGETR